MAVIAVNDSNGGPVPHKWELPPEPVALRSPIPRGLVTFAGTKAIPTLIGGNQTAYSLTLSFPKGFAYLPRTFILVYLSDDLDLSFEAEGGCTFSRGSFGTVAVGKVGITDFTMVSSGVFNRAAVTAGRIWYPANGVPKLLFQSQDTIGFRMSDMDVAADGATAGDMSYWMDFYVFDIDQIDKWEINTPVPVISHVSF